ncbi:transcription factor HES-2-like [Nerophis lumbriciformis]|uniref:transcription factor HES-2-like n=1 Tax=Nerophis lumbriciformis TaxID=546530 RepID=UPI002ADF37CE|nr:transcription factor HES-2-like [Nerophis lumbriciformis]
MSPGSIASELTHSVTSTVAQRKHAHALRKTLKPLLEKKRRARINDSLGHLKSLILPLVGKDNSRYSKLEKADILEMTVRFLRDLPASPDKDPAESYREGYKACLQKVSALLPGTSLLRDQDACQRVTDFVRRAMCATLTPACINCRAQTSRSFPRVQQRLLSLKSGVTSMRPESGSPQSQRGAPSRPAQQLQPDNASAPMWRPW